MIRHGLDGAEEEDLAVVSRKLPESPRQTIEISVVQMLATWGVQHALAFAYRKVTGHDEPTARDADVPLRRIVVWAGTSAAAVAIVNVAVDRLVLRQRVVTGSYRPRWAQRASTAVEDTSAVTPD